MTETDNIGKGGERYGGNSGMVRRELESYWHYVAREVYGDLAERFRERGTSYICAYFADIITADEGSVTVEADERSATIDIHACPDYIWQKHYDQGYSMPIHGELLQIL